MRIARSVQATLDEETAEMLAVLVAESGLSRWRWVRGAIKAAAADPTVAAAIVAAAPPERRGGARPRAGGARPGAGRPRRQPGPSEQSEIVTGKQEKQS